MECTQRLDFECSQTERICHDQIGFLGILGTKYPVKRGPNKIGRDPQTCNIVLNKNSISRQHAVINVLNGNNYMLMDLDSANKTRLNNKSLQAYIPVPISNGDTVQFGEVFGIFRLLEEETDLPCTQAVDLPCTQLLDIPETPAAKKLTTSKFKHAIIPESPDVSDKDDSFIVPSQPKLNPIKSPSNKFIKTPGKTIAAQRIGNNKTDNNFWRSSKKSNSFNLDDSNSSLNKSSLNGDIYEMETQEPAPKNIDSIYTAETQIPLDNNSPSIHSLNTQLPVPEKLPSECKTDKQDAVDNYVYIANKENDKSIFNAETQYTTDDSDGTTEQNVFEADTQFPEKSNTVANKNMFVKNMQFPKNKSLKHNIFEAQTQLPFDKPSSDESKNDIFEANTQMPFEKSSEENNIGNIFEANTEMPTEKKLLQSIEKCTLINNNVNLVSDTIRIPKEINNAPTSNKKDESKTSNESKEEILFNEIGNENFLDDFQSQPILGSEFVDPESHLNPDKEEEIPLSQSDTIADDDLILQKNYNTEELSQVRPSKRNLRIDSNGLLDNKDELSQVKPTKRNIRIESDSSTDSEGINMLPIQKNPEKNTKEVGDDLTDCEDESETTSKNIDRTLVENSSKINFEDLATQVIPEDVPEKNELNSTETSFKEPVELPLFEDLPTQVIPEENVEKDTNFEDLLTQVIPEEVKPDVKESSQFSEEIISPFKIPHQKVIRVKKKDTLKLSASKSNSLIKNKQENEDDSEKYYAATQEIFDDLCSQKDYTNPKTINNNVVKLTSEQTAGEISLGPIDNVDFDINNKVPVKKLVHVNSTESNEGEDKIKKFVSSLSAKQINDVIGINIAQPRKVPSDLSDIDTTPKKVRALKFIQTELPDSQEIKTSVSLSSRTIATESSSDSETEKESQEQTPILFRKKRRAKAEVKKDLKSKFDAETLPTRIITRTRKPTSKVQESDVATRKRTANILKPSYLTEQDDEVDSDIITENITRLRNKNDKKNKPEMKKGNGKTEIIDLVSEPKPSNQDSRKRKNNRTTNKDIVVDLTNLDENVSKTKSAVDVSNSSNISSNKSKSKTETVKKVQTKVEQISKNESVPEITTQKPKEIRRKKETQDKITNYTITNVLKDESTTSTSKINDTLNSTKETTRSTRSRYKDKEMKSDENDTKRKRGRPRKEDKVDKEKKTGGEIVKEKTNKRSKNVEDEKEVTIKESSIDKSKEQEVEQPVVRRSRRQQTVKDKIESQPKNTRTHEQSTIYNISSGSGSDSPKGVKRTATLDVDTPSPKRTRSSDVNSNIPSEVNSTKASLNNSSNRSTPFRGVRAQKVLFTAFPCEEVKEKLEKLGAEIVSDVLSCTVVLTLQLRRTFKLLCAVGLGRPIVGAAWVQACVDNNTIVDPWQYLLRDGASEARFKFSLARTLAGARGYLRGVRVSATPSVLPSAPEMKLIVECSGGTWGEGGVRWVVVTCAADRALWAGLRVRGATLVSAEFILTGVLTQHLDIDAYHVN